jgi:cytohesin
MKGNTPPPIPPKRPLKLLCFIGSKQEGIQEIINTAWQKEGLVPEGDYIQRGDGGPNSLIEPQVFSDAIKNSTKDTHWHLKMHGNEGPNTPYLPTHLHVSDLVTPTNPEQINSTFSILTQSQHIPGVRHLWSCRGGMAVRSYIEGQGWRLFLPAGENPVITHAGWKYNTLSEINTEGMARQAEFYLTFEKKYGRAPNVHDAYEYALLTSPETVYYSQLVNGLIQFHKASSSKYPVSEAGLEIFLQWQLQQYRNDRILWGHDSKEFADWGPGGLNVTTPEVRHAYLKDHYLIEICRGQKSQKITEYFAKYLNAGFDPNLVVRDGETLLSMASQEGLTSLVQLLLENPNTNLEAARHDGATPLILAAHRGRTDTIKILIEKGANIEAVATDNGGTPLMEACSEDESEAAQMLLDKGANPNVSDNQGNTPLILACDNNMEEVVQKLLDRGANPNVADQDGVTPLLLACREGDDEIVEALLKHGAQPNLAHKNGITPLMQACLSEKKKAVKLLIAAKADVNTCDIEGDRAIHIACQQGNKKIIQILIDNGADIHSPNKAGVTPFMRACVNGHGEIAQMLLELGVNPHAIDTGGNNAITLACSSDSEASDRWFFRKQSDLGEEGLPLNRTTVKDLIELLMAHDVNINQTNKSGYSPFYLACLNGYKTTAELLHKNKADVTKGAYDTFTPLMAAVFSKDVKMVDYILSLPEYNNLALVSKKTDSSVADDFARKHKVEIPDRDRLFMDKSAVELAHTLSNQPDCKPKEKKALNAIANKIEDKIAELEAQKLDKYKRPATSEKKSFEQREKDRGDKGIEV